MAEPLPEPQSPSPDDGGASFLRDDRQMERQAGLPAREHPLQHDFEPRDAERRSAGSRSVGSSLDVRIGGEGDVASTSGQSLEGAAALHGNQGVASGSVEGQRFRDQPLDHKPLHRRVGAYSLDPDYFSEVRRG